MALGKAKRTAAGAAMYEAKAMKLSERFFIKGVFVILPSIKFEFRTSVQTMRVNMDITLEKAINNKNRFNPETSLLYLKEGNERFSSGKSLHRDLVKERNKWSESQNPVAVIVTCSDSRVAPEIIFDEPLGRLFVIRIAANIITDEVLGTIEFAFLNLNVGLLLILGHESCAAIESAVKGTKVIGNLTSIMQLLLPLSEKEKSNDQHFSTALNTAIEKNIHLQMKKVNDNSVILKSAVESNRFQIIGGNYNLHSGKVEFLINE